jgi:hypothetical protein
LESVSSAHDELPAAFDELSAARQRLRRAVSVITSSGLARRVNAAVAESAMLRRAAQ